jgi:enoyl-CoA hydratase/carnithine racemase
MAYKELLIEQKGRVSVIKFNRPGQLNVFNTRLNDEFAEALLSVDKDPGVKVLIVTGEGKAFCAGIDIKESVRKMEDGAHFLYSFEYVIPQQTTYPWIPLILRQMKKPVIAAINGPAVGAGMSISLACDIRIASEKAKMSAPFGRVGLMPEFGSTYNLPRLVGMAKACELMFTGDVIDANEMKELGLVNKVVSHDELEQSTLEMANKIAQWPSLTLQLTKRALYQGVEATLMNQLQFETMGMGFCAKTKDHQEGMRAILEKRPPKFEDM